MTSADYTSRGAVAEKHGRDACVARVTRGETHASREWPWMVTPGLRGAGTAQRNGHPGLARSRDCAAQCFSRSLRGRIHDGPESPLSNQAPEDKKIVLHE